MPRITIKPPVAANIAYLFIGLASLGVSYYFLRDEGLWLAAFFCGFGILGIAAFLDLSTSYIRLEEEALYLRSKFTSKCVPRTEIEKVTWEKGAGVSVQLLDGSWVQMPELLQNSQGLSNSIRAWLGAQSR